MEELDAILIEQATRELRREEKIAGYEVWRGCLKLLTHLTMFIKASTTTHTVELKPSCHSFIYKRYTQSTFGICNF